MGSRLGWLLIPEEQAVEIWTAAEAAPLFPGLQIELAEVWAG